MKKLTFLTLCNCFVIVVFSQSIALNNTGAAGDASAVVDISSLTQGLLIPRMSQTERQNIPSPATGLFVYQNNGTTGLYYNSGTPASPSWLRLSPYALTSGTTGQTLYHNGSDWTASSTLYNSGSAIGIGTTSLSAKLDVLQTNITENAGQFTISNTSSTANSLFLQTNGSSGNALYAYSTGSAKAGLFQLNNASSSANALQSEQYGLGKAGHFEVSNASSSSSALYTGTNGSGAALYAYNNGSGRAGYFELTGSANSSSAVYISHAGSGQGIASYNNGTGKSGFFQIGVAGNSSTSLESITYGTGKAGLFTISNNTSNANALETSTNGTGWAAAFFGSALIRGKGNTSSTTAMRVENTSGVNLLKVFDNSNVSIGTPTALNYGGFSAVGLLTNKRGMTIASATAYTADAPAVLELIGSTANVGEEVTMIDFIHQSSNGSTYNISRIATIRENSNPTQNGLVFYNRQFANLNEVMRIANTGNVGIGCNSPQYKLHVVGDIAAQGGIIRASSVSISTAITACSDVRYKKDIQTLNNILPSLLQLQPVKYFFKTKQFPQRYFPSTEQIGLIAQEVEKYFPQLVVTEKDGYKALDYTRLTPLLLQAMKEQQHTITSQQENSTS